MDARVRTAINLLNAHSGRKIAISKLARAVNVSPTHLSHLFVKHIKISPTQFSRQLKFDKARMLLETSFMSVKEIMAAVGMNDQSHFTKDFKKIYGASPIEHRRKFWRERAYQSSSKLGHQTAEFAND